MSYLSTNSITLKPFTDKAIFLLPTVHRATFKK